MSSVCKNTRPHLEHLLESAAERAPRPELLLPHQREAVAWSVATITQFRGAILADDVGMGKTRVAAATAAALSMQTPETVEAIVPPGLISKWSSTFELFEVEARVISRYRIWSRSELPPASLIIVDEAHFFRNPATRGWASLRSRIEGSRVLLVTATPFWNRARDVEALVRLFADDGSFRCSGAVSVTRAFREEPGNRRSSIVGSVLLMRSRGSSRFGDGRIRRRTIEQPAREFQKDIVRQLGTLEFPLMESSGHAALVRTFLELRLSSSVRALASSLSRQRRYLARSLELARRGYRVRRSSVAVSRETPYFQDLLFPGLFEGIDRTLDVPADEIELEISRIHSLESLLTDHEPRVADLLALIRTRHAPVIIFTTAKETAAMLARTLRTRGHRCAMITSSEADDGNGASTRAEAIGAFQRGTIDLLVATEVAGEGYDLERAGTIVHYDLPWSPQRMHQREGRAWRLDRASSEIESVVFRVTGLGTRVDAVLREKERELAELLGSTSPTSPIDPEGCGRHRTVRVARRDGAILLLGGRVIAFDTNGQVLPDLFRSSLVGEAVHSRERTPPAASNFSKRLRRLQKGRARLPPSSGTQKDPPEWPLAEIDAIIEGGT